MKLIKIGIMDYDKKTPITHEQLYRGTWVDLKQYTNIKNMDVFVLLINTNNFVIINIKTKESYEISEIALNQILNEYDIIFFDIIKKPLVNVLYLEKLIEILISTKNIVVYKEHDFLPKNKMFNCTYLPQLLKLSDYIMMYNRKHNHYETLIPFTNYTTTDDQFIQGMCYFDINVIDHLIAESFMEKNIQYDNIIVENGAYDINKGHNYLPNFLRTLFSINSKMQFYHIGINSSPRSYFQYISLLEKIDTVNKYKSAKIYDNYVDKIALFNTYTVDFLYTFLKRVKYTISLMSPKYDKIAKYVSDRMEFQQIEKCLFTLPIFEKSFLSQSISMEKEVRNSFLVYDINNHEKSIRRLTSEIEFLNENENEYNSRRKTIISYIKNRYDISQFNSIIENIYNTGIQSNYTLNDFNNEKNFKTFEDYNITYNIFNKLWEKV